MKLAAISVITALFLTPGSIAKAEEMSHIEDRQDFVSLIDGRKLSRFGIKLTVTQDGKIVGDAFGREVTGAWQWRSGYFCRDLYWGKRDLGPNCQAVKAGGGKMRFISDKGAGQFADFALR